MSGKKKPWWYRAARVPKMRRKIAKATGIPATRAGRRAKLDRATSASRFARRGCLVALLAVVGVLMAAAVAAAAL